MKSKRTKATDISQAVKKKVWERDGRRCIMCGSPSAMPNAHYIRRSQGGLGIEENVVTLCVRCHNALDEGPRRFELEKEIKEYLMWKYPDWDESTLCYDSCKPQS